jgi:hypothetical protein
MSGAQSAKSVLLVAVIAVVFAVGGFFIGRGVSNNQAASLYGTLSGIKDTAIRSTGPTSPCTPGSGTPCKAIASTGPGAVPGLSVACGSAYQTGPNTCARGCMDDTGRSWTSSGTPAYVNGQMVGCSFSVTASSPGSTGLPNAATTAPANGQVSGTVTASTGNGKIVPDFVLWTLSTDSCTQKPPVGVGGTLTGSNFSYGGSNFYGCKTALTPVAGSSASSASSK